MAVVRRIVALDCCKRLMLQQQQPSTCKKVHFSTYQRPKYLRSISTAPDSYAAQPATAVNSQDELKKTCLYKFHEKNYAKMDSFAGHLMPIVYKNSSTREEHLHTRTSASVFDVSHMLQTVIRGKDRFKFIENLTTVDMQALQVNQSTLSVFTNDVGGIVDDCIINNHQDHLYIVSNASNGAKIWSLMCELAHSRQDIDVNLECLNGRRGLIALQGPRAASVLQTLVDINLDEMAFMHSSLGIIHDVGECRITRCGYTGEDGFEISVLSDVAMRLIDTLCSKPEVRPAGLAARDTLRLEAAMCLHGNDIDETTTPVEAGLAWTVHKRRRSDATFNGSPIILDQLTNGTKVRRTGLIAADKGPPARRGTTVLNAETAEKLGSVTSGCFGFSLNKNIAMAYLPTELSKKIGHPVKCSIRGKEYIYEISKLPFIKSNYYIPPKQSS